jgi:hypothetical protein
MRSLASANVVPFRQPVPAGFASTGAETVQRSLMDAVYAAGSLAVAASDRETKLVASRLQVYGFVRVDEVATDGTLRRLRASEAIRAGCDRPWRVTKAFSTAGVSLGGAERADAFLFEDDDLDQAG